jgi:hypothetical protein
MPTERRTSSTRRPKPTAKRRGTLAARSDTVTEFQRQCDEYLLSRLCHGGTLPADVADALLHGPAVSADVIRAEFDRLNRLCGDAEQLGREHAARQAAEDARAAAARAAWQAAQQTPKAVAARKRAEAQELELIRYNDRQRELAANPPPSPFAFE